MPAIWPASIGIFTGLPLPAADLDRPVEQTVIGFMDADRIGSKNLERRGEAARMADRHAGEHTVALRVLRTPPQRMLRAKSVSRCSDGSSLTQSAVNTVCHC